MKLYNPKDIESLHHLSHNGDIKYYLNNTFYARLHKCDCSDPSCNRLIEDCNGIEVVGSIDHLTANLINLENVPLYTQDEIQFDDEGNLITIDCI